MAIHESVVTQLTEDGTLRLSFSSKGHYQAEASFRADTGEAQVKIQEAENLAPILQTVIDKLLLEAKTRKTNPIFPLRIDFDAGIFANEFAKLAPQFGLKGPQPAGEFGTENQYVRYRKELPLVG